MKSIVVYSLTLLACFLVMRTPVMAQKPAIDEMSYHHRNTQADTCCSENPPFMEEALTGVLPLQIIQPAAASKKKERSRTGLSAASLFQKGLRKDSISEQARISFSDRRFVYTRVFFISLHLNRNP